MPDTHRIRTSIVEGLYVLYFPAIIGTGVLAFGLEGAVYACLILSIWVAISVLRDGGDLVWTVLITLLFMGCSWLIVPDLQKRQRDLGITARMQCSNNMKNLGIALQAYHNAYGSFPPAVVYDADGRPMHSWRVLILPGVNEWELYEAYDFNEPWDGPNNRKLLSQMPSVFACPSSNRHRHDNDWYTSYVAVVGEDTLWPGSHGSSYDDITDSPGSTVQLIECEYGFIPWTEPRDLELDEALALLPSTEPFGHWAPTSLNEETSWCLNVLRADGGVLSLTHGASADEWQTRLIINDGEPDWVDSRSGPLQVKRRSREIFAQRTAVGWVFAAKDVLFAILAILPAPFVFRRRKALTTKSQS